MRQFVSGSYTLTAGDLASAYKGIYITAMGVKTSHNQIFPPQPFRLKMASVWLSGEGHTLTLNPNGVKLYMAVATSDLGRNIDVCQRHQRNHFHLTYVGDHRIDYAFIVGVITSGCAAGDKLNYVVSIDRDDGSAPMPLGSGWCNYDGLNSLGFPGEITLISLVSGAAGNQTVSLQPAAAGMVDFILALHGYHDDTTGTRNSYWSWYDSRTAGGVSINFGAVTALANYRRLGIFTTDGTTALSDGGNLIGAKYDRYTYPSFNVDALAADKKAYVRGIVLRTYGNES